MRRNSFKWFSAVLLLLAASSAAYTQNVPAGIFYQAVARNNNGQELASKVIDVKFSVLPGTTQANPIYQEVYLKETTSRYGVFSLIIGKGEAIIGKFSEIDWSTGNHYLRVEVKFDQDFIDMGTMQFLAVPYALYAQKSLEPGPAGPKGDPGPKGTPGDPASDKQTISFDQSTLSISGGNSVPLTSLLQNLTITNSPEGNYLGISRGNSVLLSNFEGDGDPKNELQDLTISSDKLKITNNPLATTWDLTKYLDNTDAQALSYNATTMSLGISGNAGTIDLSGLKNDADASPTNEIQSLTFDQATNNLSISGGNTVSLGGMVAFRAKKSTSETVPSFGSDYDFIAGSEIYDYGTSYDPATGVYTVPVPGIYTFSVSYNATGTGDSRTLKIFLNGSPYEVLNSGITSGSNFTREITMLLAAGDKVKAIINVGIGFETGIGSFSGFKVN